MKLLNEELDNCINLKCGEIFLLTCNKYYVVCSQCDLKVLFDQFLGHFQRHNLSFENKNNEETEATFKEYAVAMKTNDHEDEVEIQYDLPNSINSTNNDYHLEEEVTRESLTTKYVEKGKLMELTVFNNDCDDNTTTSAVSTKEDMSSCSSDGLLRPAKNYPCTQCHRNYSTKVKLGKHMFMCHNSKKPGKEKQYTKEFKCADCDQTFRTEKTFINHQYMHVGISCDICGKSFSKSTYLKKHRERHTAIKSFKCEQCDKTFANKHLLNLHKERHANNWSIICELCGKRCFRPGLLRAHMLRHTGERPAKCEVCGKSFYSNYDLKQHAAKHSNERPFQCNICNAKFPLKKTLGVHMKKHSNKALEHVCSMCGKAFAEMKGLTAHMRIHDKSTNNMTLLIK